MIVTAHGVGGVSEFVHAASGCMGMSERQVFGDMNVFLNSDTTMPVYGDSRVWASERYPSLLSQPPYLLRKNKALSGIIGVDLLEQLPLLYLCLVCIGVLESVSCGTSLQLKKCLRNTVMTGAFAQNAPMCSSSIDVRRRFHVDQVIS